MKNILTIDFIGIGAAKAGTTWLADCLSAHESICLSEPKEVNFFNHRTPPVKQHFSTALIPRVNKNYGKGLGHYKRHFFHCKKHQLKGEVSPMYLYDTMAPVRIKKDFPGVKLIAILRNPVDRAYSHYWMYRDFFRKERRPFAQAIKAEKMYVERGFYYRQLDAYLKHFDREQMLILLFDDVKTNPVAALTDVFQFLDVDPSPAFHIAERKPNPYRKVKSTSAIWLMEAVSRALVRLGLASTVEMLKRTGTTKAIMNIVSSESRYPPMDDTIREYLNGVYREENKKLEKLLDRSLEHWR